MEEKSLILMRTPRQNHLPPASFRQLNETHTHEPTISPKTSARKAVENVSLPEVGRLNREFGKLLDLQQPLQRSANRIGNRNLLSLPQVIGASAGSAGGVPGGSIGFGTRLSNQSTESSQSGNRC